MRDINDELYAFDECLQDSRLVEPIKDITRYDIRKMAEEAKKLGRKLTIEEAQKYVLEE